MVLALFLVSGLDDMMGLWIRTFGWGTSALVSFYAAAVCIPVICGVIMAVIIVLISRKEDREYDLRIAAASQAMDRLYSDCAAQLDSVDVSIARMRESSEKLEKETKRISSFVRRASGTGPEGDERKSGMPGKTPAIAFEDYLFSEMRIMYSGDIIPSALSRSPQSHHKE
jgi:hypothetical protein